VEVESESSLLIFSHSYESLKAVSSMIAWEDSPVCVVVPPAAADSSAGLGLTNFESLVCALSPNDRWKGYVVGFRDGVSALGWGGGQKIVVRHGRFPTVGRRRVLGSTANPTCCSVLVFGFCLYYIIA